MRKFYMNCQNVQIKVFIIESQQINVCVCPGWLYELSRICRLDVTMEELCKVYCIMMIRGSKFYDTTSNIVTIFDYSSSCVYCILPSTIFTVSSTLVSKPSRHSRVMGILGYCFRYVMSTNIFYDVTVSDDGRSRTVTRAIPSF